MRPVGTKVHVNCATANLSHFGIVLESYNENDSDYNPSNTCSNCDSDSENELFAENSNSKSPASNKQNDVDRTIVTEPSTFAHPSIEDVLRNANSKLRIQMKEAPKNRVTGQAYIGFSTKKNDNTKSYDRTIRNSKKMKERCKHTLKKAKSSSVLFYVECLLKKTVNMHLIHSGIHCLPGKKKKLTFVHL